MEHTISMVTHSTNNLLINSHLDHLCHRSNCLSGGNKKHIQKYLEICPYTIETINNCTDTQHLHDSSCMLNMLLPLLLTSSSTHMVNHVLAELWGQLCCLGHFYSASRMASRVLAERGYSQTHTARFNNTFSKLVVNGIMLIMYYFIL